MRLHKPRSINSINVGDMEDGDVGVVISWGTYDSYKGKIVQRYGDSLIALGLESGNSWNHCFSDGSHWPHDGNFIVEILQPGTLLEV